MAFIEGCNKEEKAATPCSTSQEMLSLRFEVPKLDYGGLEEGYLVR